MTASELLCVLMAMTPDQRDRYAVAVKVREGRPHPIKPVINTGIHHTTFWLEIDP